MRRFSLDEAPQLINVLRGDMSMVGPRPLVIAEAEALRTARQERRTDLRPGLTGPWQVSGRSHIGFHDMIKLDYQYVAGWSLARDVEILLATFPAVITGRGAYDLIDLHSHVLPGSTTGRRTQGRWRSRAPRSAAARRCRGDPALLARSRRRPADRRPRAPALRRRTGRCGRAARRRRVAHERPPAARRDAAALRLGDSRCLLLECPLQPAGADLERVARRPRARLPRPARPPRARAGFREGPTPARAGRGRGPVLGHRGVTRAAASGRPARWFGLELLRDGLVHSVDSDAHHAVHRDPDMTFGIEAGLERMPALGGMVRLLTYTVPAEILGLDS